MSDQQPFLETILDPEYWRDLNLNLTVTDEAERLYVEPEIFDLSTLQGVKERLCKEGYFHLESVFDPNEMFWLALAIEALHQAGWPAAFIFIYDEVWQIFARLSHLMGAILGEDYAMIPLLWAWRISTDGDAAGWRPHRERGFDTLMPDDLPKVMTLWIPLSEATPLNGCMYILPAQYDLDYRGDLEKVEIPIDIIQNVRALPAMPGAVLGWNHAVIHWGGRSCDLAPCPRISISFEFQRSDIEPYKMPLMDPQRLPSFQERLELLAMQIIQFGHMEESSAPLLEMAQAIQNMASPIVP
jgi:hypothetical protein